MAAVQLERPPVGRRVLLATPAGHGLHRRGGKHQRQFGHMGTALDARETVLDLVAEPFQEVHADQARVGLVYGRTGGIVGSCVVGSLRGDDGVAFVDGDAQVHVMDVLARLHDLTFALGEVVALVVDQFGFQVPESVVAAIRLHAYRTRVYGLARIVRRGQGHIGPVSGRAAGWPAPPRHDFSIKLPARSGPFAGVLDIRANRAARFQGNGQGATVCRRAANLSKYNAAGPGDRGPHPVHRQARDGRRLSGVSTGWPDCPSRPGPPGWFPP